MRKANGFSLLASIANGRMRMDRHGRLYRAIKVRHLPGFPLRTARVLWNCCERKGGKGYIEVDDGLVVSAIYVTGAQDGVTRTEARKLLLDIRESICRAEAVR